MVNLALDGSLGKDLRGLLERGGGQEGIGLYRCLCDTEKHRCAGCKTDISFACVDTRLELFVLLLKVADINGCADKDIGVAGIVNPDLSRHLTCNDLDMLVVDVNRLHTVDSLHLAEDVVIDRIESADAEDIGGSHIALCKRLTLTDELTLGNKGSRAECYLIRCRVAGIAVRDVDGTHLLHLAEADGTGDLRDDRGFLRASCLEELLDTGKTLCDIGACNTSGMEGTHGKLCTRLAYRLCGYYTDSLADVDRSAVCKVGAVALRADAVSCLTLKDGADADLLNACFYYCGCLVVGDHMISRDNDRAGRGIDNIPDGVSADKTVLERLDNVLSVGDCGDPHTLSGSAVALSYNDILRHIDKTSCKVSGVSRLEGGIGKRLARTAGGDEVLKYFKTFTEVRLDRYLHCTSVRCEHKSAHTGKLTHLCHVASRSGIGHHLDRIVSVEPVLKGCDDILRRLLPDSDNVVVALLVGKLTAEEVLVDSLDLLLRLLDEGILLVGDGDVGDGDRNCRLR